MYIKKSENVSSQKETAKYQWILLELLVAVILKADWLAIFPSMAFKILVENQLDFKR